MSPLDSVHLRDLADEVHAWEINPSLISRALLHERCFDWLSSQEQAICEKFASTELRHNYLAARALCRSSLSKYVLVKPCDWRFDRGAHGKPAIAEPIEFRNLSFNLTHTRDLAVCALSLANDVGVDAEEVRREVDQVAIERHFLSAIDRAELNQLTGDARITRFYETWVLKEAYLKGCGKGLLRDPGEFTIPPCNVDGLCSYDGWQLSLYRPSGRHVAAIAVRIGPRVKRIRWKAMHLPLQTGVAVE